MEDIKDIDVLGVKGELGQIMEDTRRGRVKGEGTGKAFEDEKNGIRILGFRAEYDGCNIEIVAEKHNSWPIFGVRIKRSEESVLLVQKKYDWLSEEQMELGPDNIHTFVLHMQGVIAAGALYRGGSFDSRPLESERMIKLFSL